MADNFDLQQLTEALQSGQDLTGKNGFLTPLIPEFKSEVRHFVI